MPTSPSANFAQTDSSARPAAPAANEPAAAAYPSAADRTLVTESFRQLMAEPRRSMEYLYARLFADHPSVRSLFPLAMTDTRMAVFQMLSRLTWSLDDPEVTRTALQALARDHRKFGVREQHYEPLFGALMATAEHILGPAWSAEMSSAWRATTGYFAIEMTTAAREDEASQPAWWTGEIVQHDRRTATVAVLSVRPDKPLSYRPGQYISVQTQRWPRIWRDYSIASAPRGNGLFDIHVRAVPGGLVSTALVTHCTVGDTVTLGPARGGVHVVDDAGRDLVCVAGGTGLAPLKAIVEAVVGASGQGRRREITLYFGARRSRDLYDMRDLETLQRAYPSLTVIPVVEREIDFNGRTGMLPQVVALHPSFRDCDVYIAGPVGLISATAQVLSARVPRDCLQHDSIEALTLARRPPRVDHLSR